MVYNKLPTFFVFVLLFNLAFIVEVSAQEEDCAIGCRIINFLKERVTFTTSISGNTILETENVNLDIEKCGFFCKIKKLFFEPVITGKVVSGPQTSNNETISISVQLIQVQND